MLSAVYNVAALNEVLTIRSRVTQTRCRADDGFTIVELLVVIAILAILAALLLPVIRRARWQAQMANCISNQRQVIATTMVYHANNNCFPPSLSWGGAVNASASAQDYAWPNTYNYHSEHDGIPGAWLYGKRTRWLVTYFGKYLNDPKILTCPAGPDSATVLQGWYLNPPQVKADSITQGSYAMFWGGYFQRGFDAVTGLTVQLRGPKRMSDTSAGRLLTADATMGIENEWWSPHSFGAGPRESQYSGHSAQLTVAGVWIQPRPMVGSQYVKELPAPDTQVNIGFADGSVVSIRHRDLRGVSFGNNLFRTASYLPLSELRPSSPVKLP